MLLKKLVLSLTIVGATLVCGASAQAQPRTWVSGTGDDANPCSRTAPCKTFAGAIAKTAAKGEINCLDPGAFGTVTIAKSITIDCHEVFASVLNAEANGILVSTDTAPFVRIRNINVNGQNTGAIGYRIIGSTANTTVIIEDCLVNGQTGRGISDERTKGGKLVVTNCTIRDITGVGIGVTSSAINASINNSRVHNSQTGITVNTNAVAMVKDSVFSENTIGVDVESGGSANVDNSAISGNGTGLFVSGGTLRLSNSDVAFNATGVGGTINSYSNNRFSTNGAGGTISAIAPAGTTPSGQQ
jgi:Right handed beta helix region